MLEINPDNWVYDPSNVYPGIDPRRLARIGRTIIRGEYVRAVYGVEVAARFEQAKRLGGTTQTTRATESGVEHVPGAGEV